MGEHTVHFIQLLFDITPPSELFRHYGILTTVMAGHRVQSVQLYNYWKQKPPVQERALHNLLHAWPALGHRIWHRSDEKNNNNNNSLIPVDNSFILWDAMKQEAGADKIWNFRLFVTPVTGIRGHNPWILSPENERVKWGFRWTTDEDHV